MSDRLMQLPMTVTDIEYCPIPPGHRIICAVRWDLRSDVCNGDSGGPLACQERNGKWYLRGVASMASRHCDFWSVFTKVVSYEQWIKDIISRK